ncbi:hypothetical protein BB561_002917, partial [Smittium simulii]
MPKILGVIPSAAAEVPLTPAKRTHLEYSTVAKTGYIDPATKNDYKFNFPAKNNQNNQKNEVPGAIPSAAAGGPYHSAKRTRLEYSTVAKTGLIDPA